MVEANEKFRRKINRRGPDYPDMPHVHAAPQTKRVQGTLKHPQGKKFKVNLI